MQPLTAEMLAALLKAGRGLWDALRRSTMSYRWRADLRSTVLPIVQRMQVNGWGGTATLPQASGLTGAAASCQRSVRCCWLPCPPAVSCMPAPMPIAPPALCLLTLQPELAVPITETVTGGSLQSKPSKPRLRAQLCEG